MQYIKTKFKRYKTFSTPLQRFFRSLLTKIKINFYIKENLYKYVDKI
jgi:hypothetical protein